jgi:hypothetical protein
MGQHQDGMVIDRPVNFSPSELAEAQELICLGEQVKPIHVKLGLHRAQWLGVYYIDGKLAATCCFKRPLESYRKDVFKFTNMEGEADTYLSELGYITTAEHLRGQHFCQQLIKEMVPFIQGHSFFATTRKPEMAHILVKFGCRQIGDVFKNDLQLFVYRSTNG